MKQSLIDRDKLIHDLLLILHDDRCAPAGHIDPYYVFETIKNQPENIHCKDCKYQNKGSNRTEQWNLCDYRSFSHSPVTDDHYCGYAERRIADEK